MRVLTEIVARVVFENLFKPHNLKRTLPAILAGALAVFAYVSFEHFNIIPATGALDAEAPGPEPLGPNSIAVVPGPGSSADGQPHHLALELTRLLGRVTGLQVIAPYSAFALTAEAQPGSRRPKLDVAWRLQLRHTGQGDRTRLTASLVSGDTRQPAWSRERWPQAEQSLEFVQTVVVALSEEFGFDAETVIEELTGVKDGLYRDYLRAQYLALGGIKDAAVADHILNGVVEAAPQWAPGLAARAHTLLIRAAGDPDQAAMLVQQAADLLEQARELAPGLAQPYLYQSLAAHRFHWDWQGAYSAAHKALERAPGDAGALAAMSIAASTLGKFDEATESLRKVIALDPLSASHRVRLGLALEFAGRSPEAIDAFRDLMVFDPDFPGAHARLSRTLLVAGRANSALLHAETESAPFWRNYAMALALQANDRAQEAEAELAKLIEDFGDQAAVQIAEIHAKAGRVDQAFDWLDAAVEQRDPGVAELLGNPLLENLREDARWDALLDRVGLPAD